MLVVKVSQRGRTEWHFVCVGCMAVTDDCMSILRVMYMLMGASG